MIRRVWSECRQGTHQSSELVENKQTNDRSDAAQRRSLQLCGQVPVSRQTIKFMNNSNLFKFLALTRTRSRHTMKLGVSRTVIAKGKQIIRLAFFNRNWRHDESQRLDYRDANGARFVHNFGIEEQSVRFFLLAPLIALITSDSQV